jgi:hypothetical protein
MLWCSNPESEWDVQRWEGACFGGLQNFWAQACKFERTSPHGPRFFEWSGSFWPENNAGRVIWSLSLPDFLQEVVAFGVADLREEFNIEAHSTEIESAEIFQIVSLQS